MPAEIRLRRGRAARSFPQKPPIVSLEDARAANPNIIMAQYRKTGTLPGVSHQIPLYGDFTGPEDLQRQLDNVGAAFDRYDMFPASVREASDHSPIRFLEMWDDPEQRVLLQDAGLVIEDPTLQPLDDPTPEPSPTTPETASPSPEPSANPPTPPKPASEA